MGSLTPGATYIYESPDGGRTVYAREAGSSKKTMIGKSYTAQQLEQKEKDDELWEDIRDTAKSNKALQKLLDDVIIMYHLIREDNGKE